MIDLLCALEARYKLNFAIVEATPDEVFRFQAATHYHYAPWGDDDDPEDVIERMRFLRGDAAGPGEEFGDAWHQEFLKYWKKSEPDHPMFKEGDPDEDNFISLAGGRRISQVASAPQFTLLEGPYARGEHERGADQLSLWLNRPVHIFNSETGLRTPPNEHFKEVGPPRPMQHHYMMRRDPLNGHRVIQARMTESGRMQLFQYGDPLPFENPDYYKRRRVLDRFNREIMLEYLANLGIDPWALLVEHRVLNPVLTTCDPKGELVPPNEADVARFAEISEQLEQLKPKPYRA